jgi:CubicO group peptidase (beta-lactamase class C family)
MKIIRKRSYWFFALALVLLSSASLRAQDISGDWQATLHVQRDLRCVLHITKDDHGGWSGVFYSIDQTPVGTPLSTITLQVLTFRFSIDQMNAIFDGTLSADGNTITGNWNQNAAPKPLVFQRATKETAWPLPDPNFGHKQVPVDPKLFDKYAGRYEVAPGAFATMTREGDHLFWLGPGGMHTEVYPESETLFFWKVSPVEFTFVTDANGAVTEMVMHAGEQDNHAKRAAELTTDNLNAQCAAIDAMVAAEFAKHPVGSLTIGIVYKDKLFWTKSYGNADMEKKLAADKDTVYRIGSITKMFTAVMLEQLADSGKVHLSDPVEKYFPEVKTVTGRYPDAPPITLIQLATHTSGLDREPGNTDTYLHGQVADWEKTLIAALPHTRYAFEPGTRYSYSNIGFATLGAALARAAAQPYVEYVPQHIFQPLGMTHTAFELTPDLRAHLSKGYEVDENGKASADASERDHKEGRGYKVPNGAIYTTVGDLARFSSFLLGHGPDAVLKAATLNRNLTQSPVQANFQLSEGYMLGGQVLRRDTYVAFGHGGAVAGYLAGLYVNRNANVGVIVLVNSTAINPDALALKALDMLSK